MTFHLDIITPEKNVFSSEVEELTVPTVNGQISILPHHVALLTQVVSGEMIIKQKDKAEPFAITGGFLEVADNKVSVLADFAIHAEDISVAKAEEAKKRAEHLMSDKTSEQDLRMAQAELQKAILQLHIAHKHKRRTIPQ
ncbi:MAG TPA: ATP synthase F1 subunit epsilon [Candidatus Saccharimonadales bacterium]|nr:ATP synthase F1 subunit epsilon [Candidatus Saccharimonadales bacterium]